MGRINDTSKYPLDNTVTLDDYFIGSDIDDNNKTKTYSIRGLVNLVSSQGATSTSQLVNDGENGADPFITANDVPAAVTSTSQLVNDGENGIDPFITANEVTTSTSQLINNGENGTDPFITANDVPAGTSLAVQDGVVIDITGLTVDGKQVKQIQKLVTPADLVNNKYRVLNMFPQGANQFGVNPVVVDHFKVNVSPTEVSRIAFRVFIETGNIRLEVNNPIGLSQVIFNYTLESGATGGLSLNTGGIATLGAGLTGEDVIISNFTYRDSITNQVINPSIANVTIVVDNIPTNAVDTNFTSIYDLPIGYSLTGSDIDAYINVYGEIVHFTELFQNYIITIQFTEL